MFGKQPRRVLQHTSIEEAIGEGLHAETSTEKTVRTESRGAMKNHARDTKVNEGSNQQTLCAPPERIPPAVPRQPMHLGGAAKWLPPNRPENQISRRRPRPLPLSLSLSCGNINFLVLPPTFRPLSSPSAACGAGGGDSIVFASSHNSQPSPLTPPLSPGHVPRPSWTETEIEIEINDPITISFAVCARKCEFDRATGVRRKHTIRTGAAGDTTQAMGIISWHHFGCFSGWPRVNDDDAMMGTRRRVNYLACLL